MTWRKSSHSGVSGNCVEVAFTRADGCMGGNCVEVGHAADTVFVRDSKDPEGPMLTFNHAEWAAFLAGVKDGEFEL